MLNNVRLAYVFWELRIYVKGQNNHFRNNMDVCISRLYNNVYIRWMKMVMANGQDMIITYTEFPRMMHVWDQESRSSEDIIFQEWTTHVENIEWSRWSWSARVDIYPLLVCMFRWLMNWMMYQAHIPLLIWVMWTQPSGS